MQLSDLITATIYQLRASVFTRREAVTYLNYILNPKAAWNPLGQFDKTLPPDLDYTDFNTDAKRQSFKNLKQLADQGKLTLEAIAEEAAGLKYEQREDNGGYKKLKAMADAGQLEYGEAVALARKYGVNAVDDLSESLIKYGEIVLKKRCEKQYNCELFLLCICPRTLDFSFSVDSIAKEPVEGTKLLVSVSGLEGSSKCPRTPENVLAYRILDNYHHPEKEHADPYPFAVVNLLYLLAKQNAEDENFKTALNQTAIDICKMEVKKETAVKQSILEKGMVEFELEDFLDRLDKNLVQELDFTAYTEIKREMFEALETVSKAESWPLPAFLGKGK